MIPLKMMITQKRGVRDSSRGKDEGSRLIPDGNQDDQEECRIEAEPAREIYSHHPKEN